MYLKVRGMENKDPDPELPRFQSRTFNTQEFPIWKSKSWETGKTAFVTSLKFIFSFIIHLALLRRAVLVTFYSISLNS